MASRRRGSATYSPYQMVRIGCTDGTVMERFLLVTGSTTVGRNPQCGIIVKSSFASRDHCTIVVSNDGDVRVVDQFVSVACVVRGCFGTNLISNAPSMSAVIQRHVR